MWRSTKKVFKFINLGTTKFVVNFYKMFILKTPNYFLPTLNSNIWILVFNFDKPIQIHKKVVANVLFKGYP